MIGRVAVTLRTAVAEWADPGHGRYAKMVTRDGVLTGLVCVGMPRTGAELVLLFERARLAQAWRGRIVADGSVPPPPLSSSDQ